MKRYKLKMNQEKTTFSQLYARYLNNLPIGEKKSSRVLRSTQKKENEKEKKTKHGE